MWMLTLAYSLGDQCKMRCIDPSTWGNDQEFGNLPKWFIYTGSNLMFASYIACCAVGPLADPCREYSPLIGGVVANVLQGLAGKLSLFVMFGIVSMCNLLGCFWIYMASLCRTDDNSTAEGDPNYCHPLLWNSAYFITNGFWIVMLATFISIGARIHKFFRGAEGDVQTLGNVKLPRHRRGRGKQRGRGIV